MEQFSEKLVIILKVLLLDSRYLKGTLILVLTDLNFVLLYDKNTDFQNEIRNVVFTFSALMLSIYVLVSLLFNKRLNLNLFS